MEEVDEIKKLLKELSKKDLILLQESWKECINQGYLKEFPKICQDSYIKNLTVDDYKNYIFDDNESIEDRYAKYFRMLFEYVDIKFDKKNSRRVLYKNLLEKSLDKYTISCQNIKKSNNPRLYLLTNQYLPNSNHSPSVIVERIYEEMKYHFKNIFLVSTTPYPYPYPDNKFKCFNYSEVEENTLYKINDNTFYVEFRGYVTESLYLDFMKHQDLTKEDKFILIGHSCIHFDIIKSDKKFTLPTGVSTNYLNTANYLLSNVFEDKNILDEPVNVINIPSDLTRKNNLKFFVKNIRLEDRINLAIVGNRLDEELNEDFFIALKKVIKNIPSVRFKIIGTYSNKKIIPNELFPYIEYIDFQKDLSNYFLENINFYLNPNRNGGGHSCVMAYKVGVPIITLPFGDVYENIEKKYCINNFGEIDYFIKEYILNEVFKKNIDNTNKYLVEKSDDDFKLMIRNILNV